MLVIELIKVRLRQLIPHYHPCCDKTLGGLLPPKALLHTLISSRTRQELLPHPKRTSAIVPICFQFH